MTIKRINCFTVTCKHCKNHILVKENYWGEKLYICPPYQKKHKAIRGKDCGYFECNDIHNSLLCDDCEQNKYIKILKR